jgi:hypothetical protein
VTVASEDDRLGDFGESVDEGFDIIRADVLAVREDDDVLLQPTLYIEIAVLVQVPFVAGVEPAV